MNCSREGLDKRRQRHVAGWKSGQPVSLEIISFFDFTRVGPVVVEKLNRAGIDATYAEPPDFFDNFSQGNFTGCLFGGG